MITVARQASEARADLVVAIGGGSVTGLGKAIALRTGLPQIVVPTTYAGSEMTPILGQTEGGRKTTIRSLDPVYVDVTQSANDLLRWRQAEQRGGALATGQATLILPTGDTYPIKGELRAAEPQVEPTTGMIALRIAFPNPDQLLLPGMFVRAKVANAERRDAILAPQQGITRDPKGNASAMVVDAEGKVAAREVKVRAVGRLRPSPTRRPAPSPMDASSSPKSWMFVSTS